MSEPTIKVVDRRMFTPDGQLREEYRFLEEARPTPAAEPVPEPEPLPAVTPVAAAAEPPGVSAPAEAPPQLDPQLGPDAPAFLDLVAMLAEPAAIYLGEAPLPDGRFGIDLELARFHIDLLALLAQKTRGNLTAEESAVLDDLLARLRMRYVQRRG